MIKLFCNICGLESKKESKYKELKLMPSDPFLKYTCGNCCCGPDETLERLHVSWVDAVHLVLFHLMQTVEAEHVIGGLRFFHWRRICEELEVYWQLLWGRDRSSNWQTSVAATLSTYAGTRFTSGKELCPPLNGFWTIIDAISPADVGPLIVRVADYEITPSGELLPIELSNYPRQSRLVEDGDDGEKEAKRLRRKMRKLAAAYVFSNLDFDRPNPPGSVAISQLPTHTASQLKITDWEVTGIVGGGYAMARTTHGLDRGGNWYFEVEIIGGVPPSSSSGHVRIGVAQILAQTQGPVGFDEYSYGVRDKDGAVIHCGRVKKYSRSFGPGSIIGVLLNVPTSNSPAFKEAKRAEIEANYPPLKFGQYHVHQEILSKGSVSFTIDGEPYGIAFQNIYHAKYYPAVSIFGEASVRLNIGPHLKYLPKDYQPVCIITG